jgi:DNA-binding CsgD family transcriptional regulator/sugar-specific transcriptional regulator TrmB
VDEETERIYQCVLTTPHTPVEELASRLGLAAHTVTHRLEQLADLGVVQRSQVTDTGWRPVSPALALGRQVAEQEQELARGLDRVAQSRLDLARLMELYQHRGGHGEAIVAMVDRDEVLTHLSDLVSTVRREVAAFVTNKPSGTALEQSRDLDAHLLGRGVRLRTICLDVFRRDRAMQKALKANAAAGAEIRTVPTLPTRMIVFDQRRAVIASDPMDPSAGALLVSNHSAVALFVDLFERYWEQAVPFPDDDDPAESPEVLTVMEQKVIRLLADGHKDESIARATGQSVRTVRRIVAGISTKVGARGRFDLALHAADRGWICSSAARTAGAGPRATDSLRPD